MTIEEVLDLCEGRKLILHRGQVFINVRDHDEMQTWERRGARAVPWYTLEEQARDGKHPGWEIHLLGACEEIWEDSEDGEVNVTKDVLYEFAKARLA